jgi:hypothetical protein
MLFTDRSILTMVHGLVFGGGALLALAAALFALRVLPAADGPPPSPGQARALSVLMSAAAALLWLAVLGGTYLVFPPYRATPPEGLADLAAYPRSLLLGSPDTAWLHAFAMEVKEHVPWTAAMLATAAAFVGVRNRSTFLSDRGVRGVVTACVAISFLLAAYAAVLGTFVNKVAPLQ